MHLAALLAAERSGFAREGICNVCSPRIPVRLYMHESVCACARVHARACVQREGKCALESCPAATHCRLPSCYKAVIVSHQTANVVFSDSRRFSGLIYKKIPRLT